VDLSLEEDLFLSNLHFHQQRLFVMASHLLDSNPFVSQVTNIQPLVCQEKLFLLTSVDHDCQKKCPRIHSLTFKNAKGG